MKVSSEEVGEAYTSALNKYTIATTMNNETRKHNSGRSLCFLTHCLIHSNVEDDGRV